MKKLDLRTMIVMLVVFALGYAVCLAMPIAQAELSDATTVDRLKVNEYILFSNGTMIHAVGRRLQIEGNVWITGILAETEYNLKFGNILFQNEDAIIDTYRNLKHVTLDGATIDSTGILVENLNTDFLDGYSSEDFVLKSEFQQWFKQCLKVNTVPAVMCPNPTKP